MVAQSMQSAVFMTNGYRHPPQFQPVAATYSPLPGTSTLASKQQVISGRMIPLDGWHGEE
jgi:hypothetical protein